MVDLFWEHLDGLKAAHTALEKEYDDLKSEHERVKHALQSLRRNKISTDQPSLSWSLESYHEDLVDEIGVEPSAHAVGRTVLFKPLRRLDQDEHRVSAGFAPDSCSKLLCSQNEGKDQVFASSTPDSCNMLYSQDRPMAARSSPESCKDIMFSIDDDGRASMHSAESVLADVAHFERNARHSKLSKLSCMESESTVRRSEGSGPGAVSDPWDARGAIGRFALRETQASEMSYASARSVKSLLIELPDLSDISDVSQRWQQLIQIMILYKCRGDYQLLPCWNDHTAQSTLRRLIRHFIAELGTATQLWEPIILEWISAGNAGKKRKFKGRISTISSSEDTNLSTKAMMMFGTTDAGQDQNSSPCMLHPLAPARVIWSVWGLLFCAYDGVMLSLSIFEIETSDAILVVEWTLRVFWVSDIVACFRTGFYIKSKYENRPNAVARNYLRTWLVFDLVALVPDVVLALTIAGESRDGLSQTLKYLKVLKILRLARVAKLTVLIRDFLESLNSIYLALWLQIIKYCCLLLCWVHLVGCIWYAIGKKGNNKSNSWIIKAGVENVKLPHSYFIAIQWALCLLQGSTDVYPSFNSAMEGGFTVTAIALSILILAIFISNITNVIISLQHAWDNSVRKSRALQEYLSRHQISRDVAEAVRRYSAENAKVQLKLHLDEDDVTASLPKILRRSLLVEIRGPMVNVRNPVFVAIQSNFEQCFEKICCDLLVTLFVEPDTVVYNYGEHCDQTYFNVTGEVLYDHITNQALEAWLTMFNDVRDNLTKNTEASLRRSNVDFTNNTDLGLRRSISPLSKNPDVALRRSMSGLTKNADAALRRSMSAHASTEKPQLRRQTTIMSLGAPAFDEMDQTPSSPFGYHVPLNSMAMSQDFHLQKAFMRERLRISSITVKAQPICEPALWTTWTHHGDLHTATHTGFLTLNADSFSLLVEHSPNLRSLCACQAIRFCRVLNSGDYKRSDLITSHDVLNTLRSYGELDTERSSGIASSSLERYGISSWRLG